MVFPLVLFLALIVEWRRPLFHVIDDQEDVRDIISDALNDCGYLTLSFASSREYLDYVNSLKFERPIAVFVDITRSVMSGYEMMNIVSSLVPSIKFVVMADRSDIPSEYIKMTCMCLKKLFFQTNLLK